MIKSKILEIQAAENLDAFDIKKLTGYKDFYRIRVGKYRIGIELQDKTIIFRAIAKRDLIYKIFP